MEYNKVEAIKAKRIAERKVREKDYSEAKKFASKAQNLYPELEGIPQLLLVIDVYVAAEKKIDGEVDWYAVLDTNPSANEITIKKQLRKLFLALRPDVNKAAGAFGAMMLVDWAFPLLNVEAIVCDD